MTATSRPRRNPERGSAMLVTLILIASLLAGATVLISMQLASNRSTDLSRTGMTALYCAEAGLLAARPIVIANQSEWDGALAASASGLTTEPAFLAAGIVTHDLDGDGDADFHVYLKDNDDELSTGAGSANDLTEDQDEQVFVISVCDAFPDTPKAISELIKLDPPGNMYDWQKGGAFNNNNVNFTFQNR